MAEKRTLGVIGGSGLYALARDIAAATTGPVEPDFRLVNEHVVATPFGPPSAPIVEAELGVARVYFLPRHGVNHHLAPHEINYRANIFALKVLGAEQILSVSAVGSLREDLAPGMFVTVDQYIDRTRTRPSTFFEGLGVVAHVSMADPIDEALRRSVRAAAARAGARLRDKGTYVCIEGPQFSTRAESELYRKEGADVIGMTNLPEARLAREAELPYASLAMVTDYDCWHPNEKDVDVRAVVQVIHANAELAQRTIRILTGILPDPSRSPASNALAHAILTPIGAISDQVRQILGPIIWRYAGR